MLGSSVAFALVELTLLELIACCPVPDSELLWVEAICYSPWCIVAARDILLCG